MFIVTKTEQVIKINDIHIINLSNTNNKMCQLWVIVIQKIYYTEDRNDKDNSAPQIPMSTSGTYNNSQIARAVSCHLL